jgi:hypothetical protein
MSISAVGGVSPHAFQPIAAAAKPEAAEVAGAPDRDGDSDDRASAVASTGRSGSGSVNVIA